MLKWICFFGLVILSTTGQAQNFTWNLADLAWTVRNNKNNTTYRATIPGTIHTDLAKNGLIPEPFYASNESQVQWVENETWVYETTLNLQEKQAKQESLSLIFEGLDTYAKVYLNNQLILEADNMFRRWEVPVKSMMKIGANRLKVVFEPAVAKAKALAKTLPYTLPGDERVFIRKAPYQFGWDWGPRLVSCGIWKNVWLKAESGPKLKNIQIKQLSLSDSLAELEVIAQIGYSANKNLVLEGQINNTKERITVQNDSVASLHFSLKNPKKWWTKELGEAHLYEVKIDLKNDSNTIDSQTQTIGLRTIELVQQADSVGSSFYFTLNGVPLYMKGSNLIPPESFMPKATKTTYEDLLNKAQDQGINMLRVWGGGVYLDDDFYTLCDKKGILVWQDFMFAGGMYPGDLAFQKNVAQEIREQVTRLRNHPSLAIWCGNNELEEGWNNWGWQKQYAYSTSDSTKIYQDYTKLFKEEIPKILRELDDTRPYHPSSPTNGWGRKESLTSGDLHYWGVWWGMEPFEKYQEKIGRFVSEFGFQSMPVSSSIQKFIPENEQSLFSPSLKIHQKHPTGYETIKGYMERDYYVPKNLNDFAYVSQLLQARGMKLAIEAQRAAKPYCMGSLYWQLNDCWPVSSWSAIDYYGVPKALHYAVKRAFKPVLISVKQEKEGVKTTLVSDLLKPINGRLEIEALNFSGKVLRNSIQNIHLAANSTLSMPILPLSWIQGLDLSTTLIRYRLVDGGLEIASQILYLTKPKDLHLQNPNLTLRKLDEHTLEVRCSYLAKDVCLTLPGASASDNYFDLVPGERKIIYLTFQSKIAPAHAQATSLWDVKKD
ncbi:MAG: glycosyl hydrolase 2 galactose-binding domain-containing protein [Sphingobacteriaceae bacterium]